MTFGINHPGPWQQYVKRKDNISLPLMEVKRKYLKEQMDFDNFQTQQLNVLSGVSGGGDSGGDTTYDWDFTFYDNSDDDFPLDPYEINGVKLYEGEGQINGASFYHGVFTDADGNNGLGFFFDTGSSTWNRASAIEGDSVNYPLDTAAKILSEVNSEGMSFDVPPSLLPTNINSPVGTYDLNEGDPGEVSAITLPGVSRADSGAT